MINGQERSYRSNRKLFPFELEKGEAKRRTIGHSVGIPHRGELSGNPYEVARYVVMNAKQKVSDSLM